MKIIEKIFKCAAIFFAFLYAITKLLGLCKERKECRLKKVHDDERIDIASDDSFPASDPPSRHHIDKSDF